MAVWSVVLKNELEGSNRLDPECYQPLFIETYKLIDRFDEKYFLKEIMSSFGSGRNLEQEELSTDNIPFIRTQNVRPVLISDDGLTGVSSLNKKTIFLNAGDILSVRVGEGVGNSSIVTPQYSRSAFSDNVIRFKVKKINPYYLIIYLNCNYGQIIWEKVSKGTARSLVSKENFELIKLPVLNIEIQNFCERMVLKAASLMQESKQIYSQAEKVLLDELGLKGLDLKDDLYYTTSFKDINENNRMDAEYYMPKYTNLMKHIFSSKHDSLENLVKLKKGIEPGSDKYCREGKPFVRVSNLSKFQINDNNQKYIENNLYAKLKKKYRPKQGEILLSKDATPGIAYVVKESIEGIISSGILRMIVNCDIKKDYLALILNSTIGQLQMKRDSGGAVINHWKVKQIEKLEVPILSDSIQNEIESLCSDSFHKRKQAMSLLEEAKHKVEETIKKETGVNNGI